MLNFMFAERLGNIFKRRPDPKETTLRVYLNETGLEKDRNKLVEEYRKTARIRTLVEIDGTIYERSEILQVSAGGKIESILEGNFPPDHREWGFIR